jgi:hypothetical protein
MRASVCCDVVHLETNSSHTAQYFSAQGQGLPGRYRTEGSHVRAAWWVWQLLPCCVQLCRHILAVARVTHVRLLQASRGSRQRIPAMIQGPVALEPGDCHVILTEEAVHSSAPAPCSMYQVLITTAPLVLSSNTVLWLFPSDCLGAHAHCGAPDPVLNACLLSDQVSFILAHRSPKASTLQAPRQW